MSTIVKAGLKRRKVRVPCTQSQFMRFVLVAGFLTQSYPIPNPNPPSDVITDISRGEGGVEG